MASDHRVCFRFQLPPDLFLRAPVGLWPRSKQGCLVVVEADGAVTITSFDRHLTFACEQVCTMASAFLRSLGRSSLPRAFAATLDGPHCRTRPIDYAISLDARVSIARTRDKPHVSGDPVALVASR